MIYTGIACQLSCPRVRRTLEASRPRQSESNQRILARSGDLASRAVLFTLGGEFLSPRPSLPTLQSRSLRRHHVIRLPDRFFQFVIRQRVQLIQHHPLVAPDVRRRTNVLALNQFPESLRRALEAKPR